MVNIMIPTDIEGKKFIMEQYLPELTEITGNLHTTLNEKITIFRELSGVMGKIFLAFVYNENKLSIPLFIYR